MMLCCVLRVPFAVVCACVHILHVIRLSAEPTLVLDLLKPSDQELCWQLVLEARPLWIQLSPPCTFFVRLSRQKPRLFSCIIHSTIPDPNP